MLVAGGLDALQNGAIVAATPFVILMLVICWALMKAMAQDADTAPELNPGVGSPPARPLPVAGGSPDSES